MKSLLYISTLPKDSQTGGANAVNFHVYKQLELYFDCTYVEINPAERKWSKWKSQFFRKILKGKGQFNFYSENRLKAIATEFNDIVGAYDLVFFRGFTPWVYCKPSVPYFAYNDVHFQQFFNNTFSYTNFLKHDIDRIYEAEKVWLSNARMLFFESKWGAQQCYVDYKIDSSKLIAIGRGGNIPIPSKDEYDGGLNLVIIANNFYQKGGDLVFEAFRELKSIHKRLQFDIVGGDPGDEVQSEDGVIYHGILRKENQQDLAKLTDILSTAFLLMHCTREDINPLVPTEAGYFGCPCISVNRFALPELVINNKTGVLLSYPTSTLDIKMAIEDLILNQSKYLTMRSETWDFNNANFSWNAIGKELHQIILNLV